MIWLLIVGVFGLMFWALWFPPEPYDDDMKYRMGKQMGGRYGLFGRNNRWWGKGPFLNDGWERKSEDSEL